MKNPPEYELYDLEKDPNELVNIAGDAAYWEHIDQASVGTAGLAKEKHRTL